jgi:hypothetical protein
MENTWVEVDDRDELIDKILEHTSLGHNSDHMNVVAVYRDTAEPHEVKAICSDGNCDFKVVFDTTEFVPIEEWSESDHDRYADELSGAYDED